jgi:hypothetical protein
MRLVERWVRRPQERDEQGNKCTLLPLGEFPGGAIYRCGDEDITTLDTTIPSIELQGPIMR